MGKEQPWHNLYPQTIACEIYPDRFSSLNELFNQAVETHGDRPAFGNFGHLLSYDETASLAKSFAHYLATECGVVRGDRLAIMLPNILAYPIAMLGGLMIGATIVNVNPQYTARELEHQLSDSGAKVIVVLRHLLATVDDVIQSSSVEKVIYAEVGDLFGPLKKSAINLLVRLNTPRVKASIIRGYTSFRATLESSNEVAFALPEVGHDDIAFLQYTGGTTGAAKGAMLSHKNIIANVLQISAFFTDRVEPGKDTIITALPLYHIYALTFNCFAFLHNGGLNYLITDPRNPQSFIKELKRIRFTAISGVNTLYQMLLAQPEFNRIDFSALKYAGSGGMAAQGVVAQRWQKETGVVLSESYGLTEASPAVSALPATIEQFTGTVGVPLPSTDCSIRNEAGEEVATGQAGELWVKGPQVMQGYWQNPAATRAAITPDGWLKTGDIAKFDERGLLTIVDRLKDMIIVSGFNVYPNEIEDVVITHPGVSEVAVVGVPNDKTGEAVALVAVKKNPTVTAEILKEFCRDQLTGYKQPTQVMFVQELPKSNVGKILRREVRKLL